MNAVTLDLMWMTARLYWGDMACAAGVGFVLGVLFLYGLTWLTNRNNE